MFIDAHAHVDHYQDMAQAVAQINEHRILTLSQAVHPVSYQRAVEMAAQCPLVVPCFGVHPWWAVEVVDQLEGMAPLIEQSPMIGEIGLDYLWVDKATIPAQHRVFDFFLAAAREQDKIVNLHTKDAETSVLVCLKKHRIRRAIVHWYSGPLEVLQELIEFGAYFTVGVEVLQSKHIQQIARTIPLDRLLTETDNPGAWEWLAKAPGQPAHLLEVVAALAALRQLSEAQLRQVVAENLARLAGDDPWLAAYAPLFPAVAP